MIKYIVIDKDAKSRNLTLQYLLQFPHLTLTKSCATLKESRDAFFETKIDVLFITLPLTPDSDLSFLSHLKYDKPFIICIAKDKKDAVQAFDIDAHNFILKPVTTKSAGKALAKILGFRNVKELNTSSALFVKEKKSLVQVHFKDIYLIEALSDYVNIYTHAKRYTIYERMKHMVSRMPVKEFMQIHRSYIVRLDRITEADGDTVVINNRTIPVSDPYKKALRERLKL